MNLRPWFIAGYLVAVWRLGCRQSIGRRRLSGSPGPNIADILHYRRRRHRSNGLVGIPNGNGKNRGNPDVDSIAFSLTTSTSSLTERASFRCCNFSYSSPWREGVER